MNCGFNFVNFIIYTVNKVPQDLVNEYCESVNCFVGFETSGVIIGDFGYFDENSEKIVEP